MQDSELFQTTFGRQGMCYAFGLIVLAPTLLWPQAQEISAEFEENRDKAKLPALKAAWRAPVEVISGFRDYYNDNFPFREAAIAMDSAIRFKGLGVDWKNRVCVGQDGWMFLRETRQHAPVTLPVPAFSREQLNQWLDVFAQRKAFVEGRGAEYFVVVAPNKASVYPDMRPGNLQGAVPDTRLRQLQKGMLERGIGCIPLTEALREARSEVSEIYYRTDTHWNAIGAGYAARRIFTRLGYRSAADSISRALGTTGQASFEPHAFTGDLLRLLGATGMPREHWMTFTPADGFDWQRTDASQYVDVQLPEYMHAFATTRDDLSLPTAVIYRDSFCLDLQPFLSQAFARAVYVWGYSMDQAVTDTERPNVVLDIFVERRLNSPVPAAFK